ncbi:hypothetical protein BJ165DRAFT_1427994 [Panaeolus papilionaceus]|nr:hypothetical protein BJ165DRAFT_1427994 [Panaeolus papilionaceus]
MSDFDSLLNIEQTFYDSGFASGYAHGKIHGAIEGRALGREKGYEMWEEIAYYEGFARVWESLGRLSRDGSSVEMEQEGMEVKKGEDRASQHIRHLLSLISQFPSINPSSTSSDTVSPGSEIDIPKLQRQIRSRYKALCSTIGVRPRVHTASDSNPDSQDGVEDELDSLAKQGQGSRVEGNNVEGGGQGAEEGGDMRMSATGARGKGFIPVWKVDEKGEKKKVTNMDLSF